MGRCVFCMVRLYASDAERGFCYHHGLQDRDWAVSNRIMCAFFHRGVVPPTTDAERDLADLVAF